MATKKEHHPDYHGLRGIKTRFSEVNKDTGNSYKKHVKDAFDVGKFFVPSYTLAGAAVAVAFLVTDLGTYDDINRHLIVDSSFSSAHEHIVIDAPWNDRLALVQDENSWRLYIVDELRDGTNHLTFVEDEDRALAILSQSTIDLQREYYNIQNHTFSQTTDFYQLINVSGVYHNHDADFITRVAEGDREILRSGVSFQERYEPILQTLQLAQQQIADHTDGIEYGFVEDSTPIVTIEENPLFDFEDVAQVSAVIGVFTGMSSLILLGGALGGVSAYEAGARGLANRRRRKKEEELNKLPKVTAPKL